MRISYLPSKINTMFPPSLHLSLLLISVALLQSNQAEVDNPLKNEEKSGVECQLGQTLRKQVKPMPLAGMCLKDIIARLSKSLRSIGNDELGLTNFQEMLDQLDFVDIPDELDTTMKGLVTEMNMRLENYIDTLTQSLDIVRPLMQRHVYDGSYMNRVQDARVVLEKTPELCTEIENGLTHLANRWRQIRVLPLNHPGKICGQTGSVRNIGSLFLSHCDKPRNVVVLMEHGAFMSEEDISLARATVKTIVDMLSVTDHVAVIGLADDDSPYCREGLVRATDANKYSIIRGIETMSRVEKNVSVAIDFQSMTGNLDSDVIVVHVTNTLKDVSDVEKIVKLISLNELTVHIRRILILSDLKPRVNVKDSFINETIATLPTNNPLSYDIARLFTSIECPKAHQRTYYLSETFLDQFSKVMTVSVVLATTDRLSRLTVLISLDVKLSEFVEKFTYLNVGRNNNAILIDRKGTVLMHSKFPRVETLQEQPMKVYLYEIENLDRSIIDEIVDNPEGSRELVNKLNETISLRWRHLKHVQLIVCIVSQGKNITRSVTKYPPPVPPSILHHRIDLESQSLAESSDLCIDRRNVVSPSVGVLYISPWCLQSWGENSMSLSNLQNYISYIKDTKGLVVSPTLDSSVRNDAGMIVQILNYFKERHDKSPSKMFILRRYVVAVESGVLQLFPGVALDSSLDPKRRSWFTKATQYPGKIVVTGPYLDASGAGYVVSLSQTIYEGRSAALHAHTDPVVAVASMDMTIGYVARLLREMLPFCNDSSIKCFLMDDKGYLIFHPEFLEPNSKVDLQHLTHKELLVAMDILNHEFFVKKKLCANYQDGTIQRYFQFNISLEEVLTNVIHGEHCVKYQIAAVPGTNLFFGVVNETCTMPAFCPCSTMDRLCLNCERMEQTECECPCECSLYTSACGEINATNLEVCPPMYEQGIVSTSRWNHVAPSHLALNQCPSSNCKSYHTESECLGIIGCQWCSLDVDSETILQSPFCSVNSQCFRGVLGMGLPYSDGSFNPQPMEDNLGQDWPSVGPVAGGILAVVIIVGATLFCYRIHSAQSGSEHQCLHLHGSPDTLRMTHMDVGIGGGALDSDPIELDRTKNHLDSLLLDGSPPISPYRVSSNYRRPPGGDSDHGYSTMTPHDEPEQQSFAEPLLLVNRALEPPSPVTCLESPHRVLVPVTVHHYC